MTISSQQKMMTRYQAGFVSIIVTMIIMIVLSLIVIGFAKLVRRDQRQALDKQLNTQAFYAAETGVNDAVKAVQGFVGAGTPVPVKDQCGPVGPWTMTGNIDSATNTSYSCLLVDSAPTSLEFSNISTDQATVIPIISQNPADSFTDITISWQAKDASTGFNCSDFNKSFSTWSTGACKTGIIKMDLVEFSLPKSRDSLASTTFNALLRPKNPGGVNTTPFIASQGESYRVHCTSASTPKYCNLTITGLNSNKYYLQLKSIYIPSSVTITAHISGGVPAHMVGAQVLIDSTGKANDVLKRIQVRVPVVSRGLRADAALDASSSLCKKYLSIPNVLVQVDPGYLGVPECSLP